MKALIIILLLVVSTAVKPQDKTFNFNSPQNIRKFADFLFCDKDYLRSAIEYQRIHGTPGDDTLRFKIALCFSRIKNYLDAIDNFSKVNQTSAYYNESTLEILKTNFLMDNYYGVRKYYLNEFVNINTKYRNEGKKLFNFSYLFTEDPLPEMNDFLIPFDENEQGQISSFYNWKKDPPYKSSLLAGIMSAVIPGSGKIYVGEVGDGIVAFLVTGVFAFLAYDNFQANHTTRAWIFTAAAALFYGGNVYGSVAAAQVHNVKIDFEYEENLKRYLEKHNYYTPNYGFCDEE